MPDDDPFGGSATESEGEDAPDDIESSKRNESGVNSGDNVDMEKNEESEAVPTSNNEAVESMDNQFDSIMERFMLLQDRAARKLSETVRSDTDVLNRMDSDEVGGSLKTSADGMLLGSGNGGGNNTNLESLHLEKPQKRERKERISKRQLKALLRPDVASLKLNCARPDVVEVWDTTAPDPRILVWLKAYRNTVKVPIHWNQKRKYLSGKRAVEKLPFKLPDYIEQTKIGEIRAALLEKESQKSLKQKQREKARPKSNRMHVDFQTLHDAFFKYATKPELSKFADLYYEGKEREEKTRQFKPGQLSSKLREALGIVLPSQPPPWIIPMQRYGPPPSYPNLKVAGVNAPLPAGGQWGVHAGGWGKPPSDHFGNPLYPSVFAEPVIPQERKEDLSNLSFWGEVVELNGDEDDDEEYNSGDEGDDQSNAGTDSIMDGDGTQSVASSSDLKSGDLSLYHQSSGTASVLSGASTPRVDDVWAMLGNTAR